MCGTWKPDNVSLVSPLELPLLSEAASKLAKHRSNVRPIVTRNYTNLSQPLTHCLSLKSAFPPHRRNVSVCRKPVVVRCVQHICSTPPIFLTLSCLSISMGLIQIWAVLCLACLSRSTPVQQRAFEDEGIPYANADLENYIRQTMVKFHTPGLAVAIIDNNATWAKVRFPYFAFTCCPYLSQSPTLLSNHLIGFRLCLNQQLDPRDPGDTVLWREHHKVLHCGGYVSAD